MKVFSFLLSIFSLSNSYEFCVNTNIVKNLCIQFSVTSGTGCAWMCNYCANQLGTNNYYFTDNVCTYQEAVGCVGNPISGKSYTCCAN
jgi:hypothetical protein